MQFCLQGDNPRSPRGRPAPSTGLLVATELNSFAGLTWSLLLLLVETHLPVSYSYVNDLVNLIQHLNDPFTKIGNRIPFTHSDSSSPPSSILTPLIVFLKSLHRNTEKFNLGFVNFFNSVENTLEMLFSESR